MMFRRNLAQPSQDGAKSDRASVESVVAYAQSTACIQYVANASDPAGWFTLRACSRVGGFSPGRTLGPVVAIAGVLAGVLDGGEPSPRGSENVDAGVNGCVGFDEPVHPTKPTIAHSRPRAATHRECQDFMAEIVTH